MGEQRDNFFAAGDGNGRLVLRLMAPTKTRGTMWSQRIFLRLYGAQSDVM